MRQLAGNLLLFVCFIIIALSCFTLRGLAQLPKLPQQEVDALQEIATTMGAKYWTFNADACRIETVGLTKKQTKGSQANSDCDCNFENSTVCHVATLTLKGFSLPGLLPPQLVKLPYLRKIDFAYNYLNGTIPQEWASTKLTYISVLVNRLSGQIPKYLGHITTLTFLNLEGNQFSGIVPTELGNLVNLQTLMLSSNQLTGYLPETFSGLRILNDFRINDNNFIGTLPDWVQNWKKLTRLEMHSSGLEGPIPSNISVLNNLEELRISDTNGPYQEFPLLRNLTSLVRLVLRNCNISGEIPAYIWSMKNLEMLDVSFNKLAGQLPSTIGAERLKFVFLTGNLLSGNVPRSILRDGSVVDLSYNNFTFQGIVSTSAILETPPPSLQCTHQLAGKLFVCFLVALSCFRLPGLAQPPQLPQEEVDALRQVATTMGAKYWSFNAGADACRIDMVGVTERQPRGSQRNTDCECNFENNTVCHVVKLMIKGYSLPGFLPPQLVKLPYLREIDFAYNYLKGTIPREWASMKLTYISVLANRLSGEVPKELGNMTTLTFLNLEANQFSGILPTELGHLVGLQALFISSNQLTGNLPETFSELRSLRDFRMNDNNFNGTLPTWVQNWKQLERLDMHSSGLEGPIPSNISFLYNLKELRISDTNAPSQGFPVLRNMTGLVTLMLRNCNISGEIPAYIWSMKNLETLDVSFNNLVGELPSTIGAERLKYVFLTGNLLSGNVPKSILLEGSNVDLSYNNFKLQGPTQPECQEHLNLNLNLYRSFSKEDDLRGILPCLKNFKCPRYSNCMHINCGGSDIIVKDENRRNVLFEGDGGVEGGTAKYFRNEISMWGFSSTGDFMHGFDQQNTRYSISLESSNLSELYTTARTSPLSLTYFHYCLENGIYTITLHFAEIIFTNDEKYSSLGRRIFDIYVQERLVWKDFNIEDEAGMAQKKLVKQVSNVNVTSNILEIRFYWAGKGTTAIPEKGNYGPLISAISVVSDFKPCKNGGAVRTIYIIAGVGVGGLCLTLFMLAILWWKGCLGGKRGRQQDIVGQNMQTGTFTLEQIKAASNDFDSANKIGEGGFGPVFKGQLPDGSLIAVKQLSSHSKQGIREFLNEMGIITCLQHPNLVKLHGCCIAEDQLLLVYEYMENNSLAHVLFDQENHQIKLDWPTRLKICLGIARGLAFLHEESRIKIVHRDIKATNVLLDADINPKISDFGLAKLYEEEKTHISTKVAGTIGYMAPEYALWGHLTYKADVYSFGVVALEIVSGKKNSHVPNSTCLSLLDWAYQLQRTGKLKELIDENLGTEVNDKEAEVVVKVGLLCTNASASLRPTMSEVVSMLEGQTEVPDIIPEASTSTEDLRFKSLRDVHHQSQTQSLSGSQSQNSANANTFCSSSSSHEAMT